MIEKRTSSKFTLGFAIFCIIFFFGIGVLGAVSLFTSAESNTEIGFYIVSIVLFLGILYLYVLLLNRGACVVWIDREKQQIGRRGLLWGFRIQVDLADIQKVILRREIKAGDYFYVVDKEKRHFDACRKNSYIRLQANEENLRFLRHIWLDPIEDETDGGGKYL